MFRLRLDVFASAFCQACRGGVQPLGIVHSENSDMLGWAIKIHKIDCLIWNFKSIGIHTSRFFHTTAIFMHFMLWVANELFDNHKATALILQSTR